MTSTSKKYLAVFDFDDTVVNKNTDIVIRDLLPSEKIDALKNVYRSYGWTKYMQKIFNSLHDCGTTKTEIEQAIRTIDETPGMIKLIQTLHEQWNFDVIIISDSNSEFIRIWLEFKNIAHCIRKIFTNPADYNEYGALKIYPFHLQFECKLSSSNLCKGQVLTEYLNEIGNCYTNVIYVGDGQNDFCPILRLKMNSDYACARIDYKLQKYIDGERDVDEPKVKATIIRWENGYNLLNQLFICLDSIKKVEKKLFI